MSHPRSDEIKQKISNTRIKRGVSAGEKNPNFKGRYTSDPNIRKYMREKIKERGQSWDDSHKKMHSIIMLGSSNWMRGKKHSNETKQKIRNAVLDGFSSGKRVSQKIMTSKAEMKIYEILTEYGYKVKMAHRIPDRNKLYDFLLPELNLLLEYNGDYWHMNPKKYSSTSYNKTAHKTAEEIWKKDEIKKREALDAGYFFGCIWEYDYERTNDKKQLILNIINQSVKIL